jgi:prepilin-type N-terminal cleavage/methylation domain-containing protein
MPRPVNIVRRGFTLVELLVTLTILGVLGGMLAQMMLNQQRFFQRVAEQSDVRRELRTALSILPAELRSLSSSGGDLTALTDQAIEFRGLIGASVVCARPAAQQLDLPPVNLAHHELTSWYTDPVPGDTLYAFDEGTSAGAEDDSWVPLRITSIELTAATCLGAPFADVVRDAGKSRFRVTVAEATPATVAIGAGVRLYRHMRYELTQGSGSRWFLSRSEYSGGWSAPTLISGPYRTPTDGGMQFRYFDSTGVEISSALNAQSVSRIDLVLRGEGIRGSSPTLGAPQDSLAFRIALRNRQ